MDRRAFFGPLAFFAAYALVGHVRAAAPALDRRLSARRWIDRQNEIARALKHGEMRPAEWRAQVYALARDLDVAQLMAEIGSSQLSGAGEPFRRDPARQVVHFLDDEGRPRKLAFGAAMFSFTPANVITPHAHKNMASAHLVIQGKVRVRTFDRVRDEADALVIRPTGDHVAGVGEASAMTAPHDNVHWFAPRSERAATFDVIVSGLEPGGPDYLIQPLHPLGGRRLANGDIRAPILSFDRAMDLYPADL